MSDYHVNTAQTVKVLPPQWYRQQRGYVDQLVGALPPSDERSSSTGFPNLPKTPWVKVEWPLDALEIPNTYPMALVDADVLLESNVYRGSKIPTFSATARSLISGAANAVTVKEITLPSATRSSVEAVASLSSSNQISTNAIANLLVQRSFAEQSVLNQANEWLQNGSEAARNGDLRAAYHGAFRGLDLLMKHAMWKRVSSELKKFGSDTFPLAFGIGMMRFASSAADKIPDWDPVLQKLVETATRQKMDVRKAFRGLINVHGVK